MNLTASFPVSQYQKGRTVLYFNEARDNGGGSGISWTICKSFALCSRQITTPAPHHSIFLYAGCSSCHPTNSVKTLKVIALAHNEQQIPSAISRRSAKMRTSSWHQSRTSAVPQVCTVRALEAVNSAKLVNTRDTSCRLYTRCARTGHATSLHRSW